MSASASLSTASNIWPVDSALIQKICRTTTRKGYIPWLVVTGTIHRHVEAGVVVSCYEQSVLNCTAHQSA